MESAIRDAKEGLIENKHGLELNNNNRIELIGI